MAILLVGVGQTYTTIIDAITAAGATDDICLKSNMTENVLLSKNVRSIYSDNGSSWTSGTGNNNALNIGNGLTQYICISALTITKTAGLANTMQWNGYGSGAKIYFYKCFLRGERASGAARDIFGLNVNITTASGLTFDSCMFIGNAQTGGGLVNATTSNADTVVVKSCIFKDINVAGADAYRGSIATTNSVVKFYNNTIYNCDTGIETNHVGEIWNNIFLGNTNDVTIGGSGTKGSFLNCMFGEQPNDGGWDSTIQFSGTVATTFIDAANGDFRLLDTSTCIQSGRTISTVLDDYSGRTWPHSVNYDIGAIEYIRKTIYST